MSKSKKEVTGRFVKCNSKKERALIFDNDHVFSVAIRYLWRRKPFDLVGGNCIIVSPVIARDILKKFAGGVREIKFIDLADLPFKEAVEAHMKRFWRPPFGLKNKK